VIGRRLLHHEIVDKLGEGVMGAVYKARDLHLERFVALKVLPSRDPVRRARFAREARAASAFNHPIIVTVHDIAGEDGVAFIVNPR
jgi:serine/threonine protein kinase